MLKISTKPQFGVYIHVPFCEVKCAYCAFASGVMKKGDETIYLDALEREAQKSVFKGGTPKTVYIGGGTPSVLSPDALTRLFEIIHNNFDTSNVCEWSVEVNPSSATKEIFELLKNLGANRVSIGVQSFNDISLKKLGRIHSADEAKNTYIAARDAGFSNVSLDLMFALAGQSLEELKRDLEQITELAPEHISIYGLTPEENTPLIKEIESGNALLPDEETYRAMYLTIIDTLGANDYEHYEISNFARVGFLAQHNTNYWKYLDYEGFGPSAASYFNNTRNVNLDTLTTWAESTNGNERVFAETESLTPEKRAREAAMLMLRMRTGIDDTLFQERTGYSIFDLAEVEIKQLIKHNLLERSDNKIWLSQKALPIADSVLAEIIG